MRTRTFVVTGLLIAFLIAGVASFYASAHPDGLNFVAQKTGFIDQEKASPAADGPFAGYSTKGVDNARLSGGIAGVAGCLLVLGIAGGLTWALRRRTPAEPDDAGEPREHESV